MALVSWQTCVHKNIKLCVGPIPDLSVVDAVAIGLIGSSGSLAKNIISVEVNIINIISVVR